MRQSIDVNTLMIEISDKDVKATITENVLINKCEHTWNKQNIKIERNGRAQQKKLDIKKSQM